MIILLYCICEFICFLPKSITMPTIIDASPHRMGSKLHFYFPLKRGITVVEAINIQCEGTSDSSKLFDRLTIEQSDVGGGTVWGRAYLHAEYMALALAAREKFALSNFANDDTIIMPILTNGIPKYKSKSGQFYDHDFSPLSEMSELIITIDGSTMTNPKITLNVRECEPEYTLWERFMNWII
jgi:hypothetical protein